MGLLNGGHDLQIVASDGIDKVPGAVRYTVKSMDSISIQPGWYHPMSHKRNYSKKLYDIAVVTLPEPVNLRTIDVEIATLFAPSNLDWYPNGVEGTAMGWGILESKTDYNYGTRLKGLRKADITTQTLSSCKNESRALNYYRGTMLIRDVFCGTGTSERSDTKRPQVRVATRIV